MAHISQHGDGWRVQVAKKGVRRTKVFKTKAEAKLWASRLEIEIDSGKLDSGHTFEQATKRYLEEVTPHKRGKRFEELRVQAFLRSPSLNLKLSQINASHIAAWRDERLKTVKASTVLREVNLLRNIFRVAREEWKWMTDNPFTGVKLPKDGGARDAVWGWREIKRVLRAKDGAGPKTAEVIDAFHIALRTGMRLSEALAAPAGFDAKRQVVVLQKTKTSTKPVTVPVGRLAAKLLNRPPFVVGANEASNLFRKLTHQLMIDGLTFRDTRATALTHLSRKVHVLTLARISGHRNSEMLNKVYYRESPEQIAARI